MNSKLAYSLLVLICLSGLRDAYSRHPTPVSTDPGYVLALAAANRFLGAWQTGDLETGMVLVSDHVRHVENPEKFEEFFSGRDGRAFEIGRGTGNRGRYSFPVILVTIRGKLVHRRTSEIVVVNAGKDDWVVDKLP